MNKILGAHGEQLAENYFQSNGYQIIQKNFASKLGELDLIVRKENILIFVEVKTRTSNCEWKGLEVIGREKKRRIRKMAHYYLMSVDNAMWAREIRFDVVFVTQERVANHIEGEFLS